MPRPLLSLVIPAYAEEVNIPLLYTQLATIIERLRGRYDTEICFVDDGSADGTWMAIESLAREDDRVIGVRLSRNFGHQAALTAGLERVSGDVIVSLDCDMQDPPALILDMLDTYESGADIVYARRRVRHDRLLKKYTALVYYRLLSLVSDIRIPRNVGDFRLMNRKALDALLRLREKDRYLRGMVGWIGFRTEYVDFDRPERLHGTTGYTWRKMFKLAADGILNFSLAPLKVGLILGVLMVAMSVVFFAYVTWDALFHDTAYPLYKWLTIVMFGFMGLQFIFMWIIAEYIGRIYNESRDRPLYIVDAEIQRNILTK